MLDLDLLQAFLAVADHLSFTKAAASLGRTQSSVSMQIRRLEDRLEAELFRRNRASVELTPSGEMLLGYARRMLALNEQAVGRLRERTIEGTVRLGVMEDYGTLLTPGILAAFSAAYPRINVEMETGPTARMVDRLPGEYDVVVAMHPEGSGNGEFLCRDRAVWATSASHPVADQDPLPVALFPQGCLFRTWAIAALDAAGRPWRLAYVSHNLGVIEGIVARGLAVTVVKARTLPGRLRPLGVADGFPTLPGADIRLHRAPSLSRAGGFLADHIRAALADPSPDGAVQQRAGTGPDMGTGGPAGGGTPAGRP